MADSLMWRGRLAHVIAAELQASDSAGAFSITLRDSTSASEWTRALMLDLRRMLDSMWRGRSTVHEHDVEIYDPMPFRQNAPPSYRGLISVPFIVESCGAPGTGGQGTLLGTLFLARVHLVRDSLRFDVVREQSIGGICAERSVDGQLP